jgi:hypothetical protein
VTPDPLAQLQDYHLPDPVGWWPPAPGWWLLTLVGALSLLWATRLLLHRWRRGAARRRALRELRDLSQTHAANPDRGALLQRLSQLLRRFALARFPRDQVAGLSGERWLAFLEDHGRDGGFLDGPGRLLVDAAYRPDPDTAQLPDLLRLVRDWIAANPGGGQ